MTVKVCSALQLLHSPIWGTVSRNSEQIKGLNPEYSSCTGDKERFCLWLRRLVPGWKSFQPKNEDLNGEKSI